MRASKVAVDRVHAARVQPGAAQRPARRSRVSAAAAARATQASWPRAGACCARRAVGTSSRTPRLAAAAQPEDGARAAAAAEAGPDGAPAADVLLTEQLPCGELTVSVLTERDITGAALLLTRAFAGSPEAVSLQEATEFMGEQLQSPQLGVTLVARLVPTDASSLPKGQPSRLVGTVGLAFDLAEASTRDGLEKLRQLPPAAAYLSNMAVDPKLRRNGVARAMLRACGAAAARGPAGGAGAGVARDEIYLHVREGDEPAARLYAGYGYEEVERDGGGGGGLFGLGFGAPQRRPRILMRRSSQA